ncbi:hypothetical protein DB346_16515 [Verrucomicrobia bacterium LW23]|nr:hypothetical protein DB346_16515 [Verrucomicrobia bacterium LW23]
MNMRPILLALAFLVTAVSFVHAEPESFGWYTRPVVRVYAVDRDYYGTETFRDAETVHLWFDSGKLRKSVKAFASSSGCCSKCSSTPCACGKACPSRNIVSALGAPCLSRKLDLNGDYLMKESMSDPSGIAIIERTTLRGRKVYFIGRFGPGIYRATCLEATPERVNKVLHDYLYDR